MVHKKKKKVPVVASQSVSNGTATPAKHTGEHIPADKRARIIVRNLPFAKLSEDAVRSVFADYGNIIDISVLKRNDGKFVGCGFVEFDRRQSAAKAILGANGKLMSGRSIVVDWALPKNTFVEKVQELNKLTANIKKEESDSDQDEAGSSSDDEPELKHKSKPEPDDPLSDDDDDDPLSDDDDDDDFEGVDSDEEIEPRKKFESNDVEEGKTVFIKNVPFSATDADLKKCVETFGPVHYALICVDKLTEHSKGSAFAKFKDAEDAKKCIQASQSILLKDQPVEVTRAVSRSKLEQEKNLKKLKTKDSRNLYLVREGVVLAGSPAAAGISAADMAKRLQLEQWKTQMLRDLNMFVAKTRLVVHNLPARYDDADLRTTITENAPVGAVVKEARVMQERGRMDGQGRPLSKEVGFVTFTTHEDALHVLRAINNNPHVFTPSRRPIVSFSIENRQILHLKQKRLEKSQAKIQQIDGKKGHGSDKLNRKQRRFQRRKEKIIKLRQEGKKLRKEGESTPAAKSNVKPKPQKSAKASTTAPVQKAQTRSASNVSKSKRKAPPAIAPSSKKPKVAETQENYGGVQSVPGKKLKMRSRLKLKKQAEIHKERLKQVKKVKKIQKGVAEKREKIKKREPQLKKKKVKSVDNDGKLSKLIKTYRQKIENASTFRKWYDT